MSANHYEELNACAQRYAAASNPAEKRQALRDYLYWLRIEVILAGPRVMSGKLPPDFEPLEDLVEDLHRIENGECPELLTPTPNKRGGAPPTVRAVQWHWARASALVTVLMKKFNKTEDEAAKITARGLEELRRPLPGRGRNAAKSLQEWRDKLLAGQKSEQAVAWYEEALIAPFSFRWDGVLEVINEKRAIQILLNPSAFDYDVHFTY